MKKFADEHHLSINLSLSPWHVACVTRGEKTLFIIVAKPHSTMRKERAQLGLESSFSIPQLHRCLRLLFFSLEIAT
jgi:hypothetical protein